MPTQQREAERDLPTLVYVGHQVETEIARLLGDITLIEEGDQEDWDHTGFMAAAFVSREVVEMRAVLILVESGLDKPALIVARGMLEGMFQLMWAYNSRPERPLSWREFSIVEDWRTLQQAGDPTQVYLAERIAAVGPHFHTRKAKNATRESRALPDDPYLPTWHGKKIRQLFDGVPGGEDLWTLYRRASRDVHCSVRSVGSAISRHNGRIAFGTRDRWGAATAVASAIQALLESAKVLCLTDALACDTFVDNLQEEYLAAMTRLD